MEIQKLLIPELEAMMIKAITKAESKGNKWAETKALYESLEDKKKPLIARLSDKYEGKNNAKEAKALADSEYKTFIEGLSEARHEYYQQQVAYDMAKLKIDALRTIISARKIEVQNFRG